MAGALYCTGSMPELAEMFEPDKEILVHRSPEEMLDKVRYYACHATEANRIRVAGRARALKDHTYHRRFQQLFHALKLA